MFCELFMIVNFQVGARDYNVRINIISFIFMGSSFHYFFTASLGSVIFPVRDEAATTIGEAKYVCDSTCPILPGKFRFVVLMQISSLPNTPICAPQHAPHVGGPTTAPASTNVLISPSL